MSDRRGLVYSLVALVVLYVVVLFGAWLFATSVLGADRMPRWTPEKCGRALVQAALADHAVGATYWVPVGCEHIVIPQPYTYEVTDVGWNVKHGDAVIAVVPRRTATTATTVPSSPPPTTVTQRAPRAARTSYVAGMKVIEAE